MSSEPKILLATLWQRTSARGNEYLSGFLGTARIVGFRGAPTAEGVPMWNLYLAPGQDQQATSESSKARRSAPRRARPTAEPSDLRPFDDPIGDIGT